MLTTTTESPRLHPGDVDFTQLRLVNRGGYCDLYQASHAKWGPVALKLLRPRGEVNLEREQKLYKREAKVWEKLWHPNVVRFYGCLETDSRFYLVSPWITEGNVQEFLVTNPTADRLHLIRGAADGLDYLHNEGLIHGDLKAANILVKRADHLFGLRSQLCDFGMSKFVEAPATSSDQFAGSVRWMSPEILLGESRSFPSDIYAFGMTIYEVLYDVLPFARDGDWTDVKVIMKVTVEDARPSCGPKFLQYTSLLVDHDSLVMLARRCWSRDPNARWTIPEIKIALEKITPLSPKLNNFLGVRRHAPTAHYDPGPSKPGPRSMTHQEIEWSPMAPFGSSWNSTETGFSGPFRKAGSEMGRIPDAEPQGSDSNATTYHTAPSSVAFSGASMAYQDLSWQESE